MSMSTKIDDLPGPISEEVKNDINNLQRILPPSYVANDHVTYDQIEPTKSNISMNITKKTQEETGFVSKLIANLKSLLNEDNLILLSLFVLASLPFLNSYLSYIPFFGNYVTNDNIIGPIVKSILLLITYILLKSSL